MRGEEGDLDRALELGEEASERWPGEERSLELAEHYHMHANVLYWTGSYERGLELAEQAAATGGLEPRSAEFLLRGAGQRGLMLAGMGRYEEAVEVGNRAIATARRMGRGDNVVTNYSTTPLRDIFALEDARSRSETVADRLGPSSFNMPWINALADELGSPLLRWHARAALSLAERQVKGSGDDADRHAKEAADIIHAVAKELSPEHATGYLVARQVAEALELTL